MEDSMFPQQVFVIALEGLERALQTLTTELRTWWVTTNLAEQSDEVLVCVRDLTRAQLLSDIRFALPILKAGTGEGCAEGTMVMLYPGSLRVCSPGVYRYADRLVWDPFEDYDVFWEPLAEELERQVGVDRRSARLQ